MLRVLLKNSIIDSSCLIAIIPLIILNISHIYSLSCISIAIIILNITCSVIVNCSLFIITFSIFSDSYYLLHRYDVTIIMKRYGMCVITGRCDTYLRIVPFPTFINITTLNYIYIYTYLLKFSDNTLLTLKRIRYW